MPSGFNPTAPVLTSGKLQIKDLSEERALEAMATDPLLIKRPLMIVNGHYLCGFDTPTLEALIGLDAKPGQAAAVAVFRDTDVVACPQQATQTTCDKNGVTL